MKLTITKNPTTSQITLTSKGFGLSEDPFEDSCTMLLTALTHLNCSFIESIPPSDQEQAKAELYDRLNIIFHNILSTFEPKERQSLDSLLTEQAILEAENAIIDRAAKAGKTLEEYLCTVQDAEN